MMTKANGRKCDYCGRRYGAFSYIIEVKGKYTSFYLHLKCVKPMKEKLHEAQR